MVYRFFFKSDSIVIDLARENLAGIIGIFKPLWIQRVR